MVASAVKKTKPTAGTKAPKASAEKPLKKAAYSEKNIERYAGLAGIRKKPAVYVGPMDSSGMWTICREPLDNVVDRRLAGDATMAHLIIDGDKDQYWILDDAGGIPVGMKVFEDERGRKEKMSTLYVVTGLTHGGGNFSGDVISRGTHGIGIKATNSLSKTFDVYTFRDKKWHCIRYAQGKLIKDVHTVKGPPKLPHGVKIKSGTAICFSPDRPLFSKGAKISEADIAEWSQVTSYLVPGFTVKITNAKGKTTSYMCKRGPIEFIEKRVDELKCKITGKPFLFSSKEVDVAVAFSDAEGATNVFAYTNGLRNAEGGEHVEAFFSALAKSLKPYKGKLEYTPTDLKEGLLGLVNYKISAPQFNNQTKDKLIDGRVKVVATEQILKALTDFWAKNKSLAKAVLQRASELRKRTADFLKDKKLIKNVRNAALGLSAKLADVGNSKLPFADRELYLVEGDSAGGTAKVARHRAFQATLALKGKPLNVAEVAKAKVTANKEIASIFAGIGLDPGAKDPISKIRFGKLIYLTDPDVDGKHINTLLSTLFWKYLPDLFKRGCIYMLMSPEYMARYKGKVYFGASPEEVRKKCGQPKIDVRHIKGWGELNAEDMQGIAFDIGTRQLIRLLPPRDKKGADRFNALMGKKSTYRQKLLGVVK